MRSLHWIVAIGLWAASGVAWGEWGEAAKSQQAQPGMGKEAPAKQAPATKAAAAPAEYDFGDFSSETLTTKAWKALDEGDYAAVEAYTTKCISLYESQAVQQQSSLTDFAPKDKAFDNWALNDVATCYFILGESLLAQKRYQEAKAAFDRVVNDFGFAQCWDPKGWFWKVAVASRGRLNKILAESGS